MKRYIFLSLFAFLVAAPSALADKVYLKDGKVLDGVLLSQTQYSVKILVKGFPRTLYWDQIDHVEEDEEEPQYKVFDGPVSEEKRELVLRFFKANGALEGIRVTLLANLGELPPEQRKQFEEYMKADKLIDKFVEVYARHFTEEELRDLIRFYDSSTGKKILELTPDLIKESIEAAVQYFTSVEAGQTP